MPAPLFDSSHRGLLLDIVVFAVNLLGMNLLMRYFLDLVRAANADDPGAMTVLFGFCIALMVLAPLGATLKRWSYHQRLGGRVNAYDANAAVGCLFNPIFYFCLVAVIFATVNAFLMQRIYGRSEPDGNVFVSSIFIGIGLIIVHTWLVYRYFSPPQRAPAAWLRSHPAEVIGDVCLFTNMLIFQVGWNALSFAGIGAPSGVGEAFGRLALFVFMALLLYFPPRMFYLAEDIGKRRTWFTILLANSPVILRLVLGS